jgi:hypothetical protein
MGAAGRNILKLIGGSAVGAGIGALFARGAETASQQGPPAGIMAAHDSVSDRAADAALDAQIAVEEKKESLKERWERAQVAGEAAKEAREAELRAYFREKVDDPTAFPPGAPTRSDT